jgi:hypothetical protein
VCFESGASPKRLHDDDDDEYHSMFCCMIFGMSSAHGSLPVAPVCPIAVNPIMRSGAGGLTSRYHFTYNIPLHTYDTGIGIVRGIMSLLVLMVAKLFVSKNITGQSMDAKNN